MEQKSDLRFQAMERGQANGSNLHRLNRSPGSSTPATESPVEHGPGYVLAILLKVSIRLGGCPGVVDPANGPVPNAHGKSMVCSPESLAHSVPALMHE